MIGERVSVEIQRERKNARSRELRLLEGDSIRARDRMSRDRNARNAQARAAYAALTPEARRKRAVQIKVWRAANRVHINEQNRARLRTVPGLRRKYKGNRRARELDAFVEVVDLLAVYVRDGGVCQICDRFVGDAKWEIDHRIPLARGGLHSYANSQLAHAHCNRVKAGSL